MRVAQISEFGGIAALRLEEAAEPTPGPGEILVRVTAVGLNFSDTLILRNKYQVTPQLPFSPGAEIAGSHRGPGRRRHRPEVRAKDRRLHRRQWLPRADRDQGRERRSHS